MKLLIICRELTVESETSSVNFFFLQKAAKNEKRWQDTSLDDFMVDSSKNPGAVRDVYITLNSNCPVTHLVTFLQDLTHKEVKFLVDNDLKLPDLARNLGYDFANRSVCGRLVEREPQTFEEAANQLNNFHEQQHEEWKRQERVRRRDKKKAKAVLKKQS